MAEKAHSTSRRAFVTGIALTFPLAVSAAPRSRIWDRVEDLRIALGPETPGWVDRLNRALRGFWLPVNSEDDLRAKEALLAEASARGFDMQGHGHRIHCDRIALAEVLA